MVDFILGPKELPLEGSVNQKKDLLKPLNFVESKEILGTKCLVQKMIWRRWLMSGQQLLLHKSC